MSRFPPRQDRAVRRAQLALLSALAFARELKADTTQKPTAASSDVSVETEVVVKGQRADSDAFELKIPAAAAGLVAGTQGDPIKVTEALPGVARANLGGEPGLFWGAAPQDSRSYVDGVEVPSLFHYAGLRSVLNPAFLADVSLTSGAYGAAFGRGLGGMVQVTSQALPSAGQHAVLDVNTLDGSVWVSAAWSSRLRVSLAGRYAWIDRLLPRIWRTDSNFFAIPSYADYQAKAELDLRAGESLSVVLLGSRDKLTHAVSDSSARQAPRSDETRAFERLYAVYKHQADTSETTFTVWVGRDQQRYDARFGSSLAATDESSLRWGLRAQQRATLSQWLRLNLGVDLAAKHGRFERDGSLTIPGREGDAKLFGQGPGSDVNTDQWRASSVDFAPYLEAQLKLRGLKLTPGVRVGALLLEASRTTPRLGQTPELGSARLLVEPQPRLQVSYAVSSRVSLHAAAGRYYQAPQLADMSAVFGRPSLGPERADHVALGESIAITESLSVTTQGFYRALSHLTIRDAAVTPKLAQALLQNGEGRSYGVDVLLRQLPRRGFYGWLALTLSRSERRDGNAGLRLFDYDQPFVAALVLGKAIDDWDLGLRFRYASGNPRTPVVAQIYNGQTASFEPILGEHNTTRLPGFWQLDFRIERRFLLPGGLTLALQLEVLNATNHLNVEEYAYSSDYSQQRPIRGLPIVGVFGARLAL